MKKQKQKIADKDHLMEPLMKSEKKIFEVEFTVNFTILFYE